MPLPCGISLPHAKARVLALLQHYCTQSRTHHRPHVSLSEVLPPAFASCGIPHDTPYGWHLLMPSMRARVALRRSQFPWFASVGRCFPPGFCGSACRSVNSAAGALSCALLAPACQPLALGDINDGSSHLSLRVAKNIA